MLVAIIVTNNMFDFYLRFDRCKMKTKHHTERIALRLPSKQRQQIDKLVESGKFKNLSQVIRAALKEFLEE